VIWSAVRAQEARHPDRWLVSSLRLACLAGCLIASSGCRRAPNNPAAMSFFITSVGLGDGGNLGGIEGADAHCQKLASDVGAGGRQWRAYLSAPATANHPAINARERIGRGPWLNAKGLQVAATPVELHADGSALGSRNSLTERGTQINSNVHDMLTGSTPDGVLAGVVPDATCHGWTSNSGGHAMVGHHDRRGGGDRPTSWNSAHQSASCSAKGLDSTLGAGLFYCFAIN
jgi:hypothetical protein